MPFGDFGLGSGIFGADPVYIPVAPSPVLPPRAVFYDPSRRGFYQRDANGNAIDVHPVDQMVALRWTMQQGDSPSSVDVGTRIRARFTGAAPDKHQQIANDELTKAIADLIAAGDVQYLGVTIIRNSSGAENVVGSYVNLRDPNTNPLQPTANPNTAQVL